MGVEEQFYIFAPLILWLLVRYARKRVFVTILLAFVLSFALCVYFTPVSPSPSFYLLPFRAWELLVGSLLAVKIPRIGNTMSRELLSGAGLFLLCIAVFTFDKGTAFPGYAALVPVLGAALIIGFAEGSRVGRLLGFRPFVFIGLLSYSLYLWHWPLIVFFQDLGLLDTLFGETLVVVLSLAVSWLSWKFVETPFRRPGAWPRIALFKFAGTGTALLAAAALAIHFTDGWPNRFTPEDVSFDVARNDFSPERKRCHVGDGEKSFDQLCRLGSAADAEPDAIVWSDSHGVEMAAALAAANLPVIQASYSACPPVLEVMIENRPFCDEFNMAVFAAIEKSDHIKTVILSARYAGYPGVPIWDALQETIRRLKVANKTVVVLGPLPDFGIDVPSYLASGRRNALASDAVPPEFFQLGADVKIINLIELLCGTGDCPLVVNGKPLLFDDNHLSMTAARSIAGEIVEKIQNAKQAAD